MKSTRPSPKPARRYVSAVRERQKDETEERILEALAALVREDGVHAFNVPAVAKRAGISQRTVYRYFPSRQSLLDTFARALEEKLAATGLTMHPRTVDDIPAVCEEAFAMFGDMADVVRALVMTSVGTGMAPETATRRSTAFARVLDREFPDVSAEERRQALAVLRTLVSSRGWFVLTQEFGLDSADAGRATAHSARVLLEDLARRNAAAKRRGKS